MSDVRLPKGIKKRIHVNQHRIRKNSKEGTREPVITTKTSSGNFYGSEVQIKGESRVIYRPDAPLPCGAKVWIETVAEIVISPQSPPKE